MLVPETKNATVNANVRRGDAMVDGTDSFAEGDHCFFRESPALAGSERVAADRRPQVCDPVTELPDR